jgi:hypothetical protein
MKRIATGAIVVVALAVPTTAFGRASSTQVAPDLSRQVVRSEIVKSARYSSALAQQRVSSQQLRAQRFSAQLRLIGG